MVGTDACSSVPSPAQRGLLLRILRPQHSGSCPAEGQDGGCGWTYFISTSSSAIVG